MRRVIRNNWREKVENLENLPKLSQLLSENTDCYQNLVLRNLKKEPV